MDTNESVFVTAEFQRSYEESVRRKAKRPELRKALKEEHKLRDDIQFEYCKPRPNFDEAWTILQCYANYIARHHSRSWRAVIESGISGLYLREIPRTYIRSPEIFRGCVEMLDDASKDPAGARRALQEIIAHEDDQLLWAIGQQLYEFDMVLIGQPRECRLWKNIQLELLERETPPLQQLKRPGRPKGSTKNETFVKDGKELSSEAIYERYIHLKEAYRSQPRADLLEELRKQEVKRRRDEKLIDSKTLEKLIKRHSRRE